MIDDFICPGIAKFRCLYVGKGPSAVHAKKYASWGDVATVNEAASLAGISPKIAFCDGNMKSVEIPKDVLLTIAPKHILQRDSIWSSRKIWTWKHKAPLENGNIADAIRDRQPTDFLFPSPSGVLMLWLMGYRQIWLFGHDGGKGVAEGFADVGADYSGRREAIEFMQPLLAVDGCEVKFWPEVF